MSGRPNDSMPACRNSLGSSDAVTEDLAQVAEALRPPGARRRQVVARHRDGEVGPQAELAALRIGGEEHALADVLAREVEERFRRLQHGRREARVAGALIGGDQRVGARVASPGPWY